MGVGTKRAKMGPAPRTLLSLEKILKASVTCFSVAPPPTSKKLAGLPEVRARVVT